MFENFSESSKSAMKQANAFAAELNHEYIGTEHILYGIAHIESDALTAGQRQAIKTEIAKLVTTGPLIVTMGKLPLTPRAKQAIEKANAIAIVGNGQVEIGHLIWAMKRTGGTAADVLLLLGNAIGGVPEMPEVETSDVIRHTDRRSLFLQFVAAIAAGIVARNGASSQGGNLTYAWGAAAVLLQQYDTNMDAYEKQGLFSRQL